MKFIVNKKTIETPLSRLVKVIQRTSLPILDCVLLDVGDVIKLTTANQEMKVSTCINANIENKGNLAVNAKDLYSAIKQLPDVDIEFTKKDNLLTVRYNKGRFKIPAYDEEDFPIYADVDSDEYTIPHGYINDVVQYIANDELRPVMNGVFLDFDKGNVVASDGHKLIKINGIHGSGAVILPSSTASFVKDMGELKVKFNNRNIIINSNGYNINSRVIEGRYPNYDSVIPSNQNKIAFNRDEILGAIRRVSIFSNESGLLELNVNNDATLKGCDLDFNTSAKEKIKANGDPIKIGFKSSFLSMVINSTTNDNVIIEVSDPSRAAVIRENNKTILLMPMVL